MGQTQQLILDEKREVLGSLIRITVVVDDGSLNDEVKAREAMQRAFIECERIDQEFSRFKKDNQLIRMNASVNEWQKVSAELYYLLEQGLKVSKLTEGAFDLGVKSILEKWGYDEDYSFKFKGGGDDVTASFNANQAKNNQQKFSFELADFNKVKIFQSLELGGLGKGYALDRMVEILKEFPNFCVDAGGDIYARGAFDGWEIFFEDPKDLSQVIGRVKVDDFFVASSNPLKRRWVAQNGVGGNSGNDAQNLEFHHLVDPQTGHPANNMMAVYTQAKSGLLADAYSTALFAMGFNQAKGLFLNGVSDGFDKASMPIEAMLISPSGEIFRSAGFKGELFT